MRGLLGPQFYQPPTKLQILRRRIFVGSVLWVGGVILLSELFEHTPFAIIAVVFTAGGFLAIMWLGVRHFYRFVFRDDEVNLKRR